MPRAPPVTRTTRLVAQLAGPRGHGASPPQRSTALAAVMPAPKPTSSTRSPFVDPAAVERVGERQRDRRRRRVAGAVEHGRRRAPSAMPRRSQAASMMRMLAWWGTTSAMSSAVTPACVHRLLRRVDHDPHGPAEDLLAVHLDEAADLGVEEPLGASRRRRGPSRAAGPGPSTASSTTAPEPSANRMAVLRSSQSVMRDSVSVPITSTLLARPWRSGRGPRRARRRSPSTPR